MKITLGQDKGAEIKVHLILEKSFSLSWGWEAGGYGTQLLQVDQYSDSRVVKAKDWGT